MPLPSGRRKLRTTTSRQQPVTESLEIAIDDANTVQSKASVTTRASKRLAAQSSRGDISEVAQNKTQAADQPAVITAIRPSQTKRGQAHATNRESQGKGKSTIGTEHTIQKPRNGRRPPVSQRKVDSEEEDATYNEQSQIYEIDSEYDVDDIEAEVHPKNKMRRSQDHGEATKPGHHPIHKLDKNGSWADIIGIVSEIKPEESFKSPRFRQIGHGLIELRQYIIESENSDELQEKLGGDEQLGATICAMMDKTVEAGKRFVFDLCGLGIVTIIDILETLFTYHVALLLDPDEIFTLKIATQIIKSTIKLARNTHVERLKSWTKPVMMPTTLTSEVASIIIKLQSILIELEHELHTRRQNQALAGFEVGYRKAHQELASSEAREARDHAWPVEWTTGQDDHLAPEQDTSLNLRAGVASTPEIISSGIHWTSQMDEELIQSLNLQSQVPLPERYRRCLLSPGLQNLLEDHIRARALLFRPSLTAWYEERNEPVPDWVSSIA